MKKLLIPLIGAALIGGSIAGAGLTAFAAEGSASAHAGIGLKDGELFTGTVTSVSGSTITLAGKDGATYTINASASTTVEKFVNGSATSVLLAQIAVGDTVAVKGTLTSATVSATSIRDGVPPKAMPPVAAGKVTAISGSTLTLSGMLLPAKGSNKNHDKFATTTLTVNAAGATVSKVGAKDTAASTISLSQISIGDMLLIRGTASSTNVTATAILDGASGIAKEVGKKLGF